MAQNMPAVAAVVNLTSDRLPLIMNELLTGANPPGTGMRITELASESAVAFAPCAELTPAHQAAFDAIPPALQEAEEALAKRDNMAVNFAYQRASGCINEVCASRMTGTLDP